MEEDRAPAGEFQFLDPNLEEKLVNELKAQGVFDQFRKDCLSDVDTKPAYQNLRNRVDKSVSSYLGKTNWRPSLNKNQLRNQLRKYIQDMSSVEAGVDRIVDQIVNPKLNSTLLPEVEEVIYKCFGTTKEEVAETDLVNGNDDEAASHSNQNGASNHHEDPQAGKISARNLSAISSEADMMNLEAGRSSVSSSPGPGLAGHVSPLTPGASPSVNRGDISPLTPANTPPPPPPGEDKTEEVGMEVDVEEERPASAYTPPLPAPAVPSESPSYTPPLVASPAPVTLPPPPPPPPESGGEASMSSISDTDLGDVSPPRPAPAPALPPTESPGSGSGSDEDLQQLMKMKAELMAQLEGDFKLSPEESDDEDELEEPAEKTESAPGPSVSSGSPSPPPATPPASSPPAPTPPGEEMSNLTVEEPSGCKPYSSPESKSPSSGDGGSGPGSSSGPPPPPNTAGTASDSGGTGEGQQENGAGKGQEEQRSHSKHHSSSRHHSGSMSKEEKKKYDKLKEHHKAKIEKYEQKIKSKDKLKSDKYQDLDIFSNTKKPGTPHLPTARGHGSSSSSSSTPKPQKKEFEKKLDEEIRKELERREEKRKEKQHSDMKSFKTPVKVEDRRSSSDKERSDKKERRSSKDDRHDSHSSRHRHDSDRKHKDRRHSSSSDKERRHSSSSSSSSGEKKAKERRSSTDSKYSKERELQEVESKRRLQEARLRREREEKEKSRSQDKDKRSKDYEKNRKKPKDEINDLLKEKISSLGVDNIQKMLMESLMEKTGAKVSDEEKQKMMAKMEDIIKEKKPATESPPVTKKIQSRKVSPKKKRNSSGATSSSSSSSNSLDSDDEIKEMRLKVKSSRSKPVSRPVRIRKVRTFDEEEDKSDSDGDFVKPVKSDVDNASVSEPDKVAQELPVEEKKQKISIAAVKKIDDDPNMPSMNGFSENEVGKTDSIIEKLRELLTDEDSIDIEPVTEVDINNAIPTSRVVQLDPGTEPEALIQILSKFGGNPRLTTPVPEWLNPYLVGAKVKTEDVEMPTMEEVREHLLKKNSGKRKRGAGWDIVVDWVPQEQPAGKRSKIEKELGFDFDSSFGCSINVGEGRRSRRSNTKYTTTSEEPVKKSKTVAKVTTKTEEEGKSSETSAAEKISTEGTPAEESSSEKSPAEEVCSDGSPGKKRRSRDIIAAYLTSAGAARDDDNEVSNDDTGKTLAKLDAEIEAADQELESVLTTLKNRRKRPVSGDGKFHGFESGEARVVKKTALSSGETNMHLEEGGAAFGLSELDFLTEETDPSLGPGLLEVVFSEPMLRDVQRLSGPKGITQIKSVPTPPDSDQDDLGLGSSSPDSYGSSKENDPEIVNSVTTIYKQSKGSSARKKSNMKNPVLKAQLEVK